MLRGRGAMTSSKMPSHEGLLAKASYAALNTSSRAGDVVAGD